MNNRLNDIFDKDGNLIKYRLDEEEMNLLKSKISNIDEKEIKQIFENMDKEKSEHIARLAMERFIKDVVNDNEIETLSFLKFISESKKPEVLENLNIGTETDDILKKIAKNMLNEIDKNNEELFSKSDKVVNRFIELIKNDVITEICITDNVKYTKPILFQHFIFINTKLYEKIKIKLEKLLKDKNIFPTLNNERYNFVYENIIKNKLVSRSLMSDNDFNKINNGGEK